MIYSITNSSIFGTAKGSQEAEPFNILVLYAPAGKPKSQQVCELTCYTYCKSDIDYRTFFSLSLSCHFSHLALPTKNSPPFIGHYTITRPLIDNIVLQIGLSLIIICFYVIYYCINSCILFFKNSPILSTMPIVLFCYYSQL